MHRNMPWNYIIINLSILLFHGAGYRAVTSNAIREKNHATYILIYYDLQLLSVAYFTMTDIWREMYYPMWEKSDLF
jgi:hypothetical protein